MRVVVAGRAVTEIWKQGQISDYRLGYRRSLPGMDAIRIGLIWTLAFVILFALLWTSLSALPVGTVFGLLLAVAFDPLFGHYVRMSIRYTSPIGC